MEAISPTTNELNSLVYRYRYSVYKMLKISHSSVACALQ